MTAAAREGLRETTGGGQAMAGPRRSPGRSETPRRAGEQVLGGRWAQTAAATALLLIGMAVLGLAGHIEGMN